jgi:putative nucleotidyltransferase with HDIG domain
VEVAFLAQIMADELNLDGSIARRAGLLHDIGKAIDHEIEGGHATIGANFLKRFSESSIILNAVESHHGDVPPDNPYSPLIAAADAMSASRPGARRETLERYIKRLEKLEEIANGFPGVENTYAIQAGREIRVIVNAAKVSDDAAMKMARDIANKIGTYQIAVVAKYFKIPFYVICPPASKLKSGKEIKIEIRPPDELKIYQGLYLAPKEVKAYYPAFDVTPAKLITRHIYLKV